MKESNDIVSERWYRIWKATALQACMQKWCDESILTALWFEIEQLIFNSKVRQQQSVISTVSVLCRLFETYAHQIWAHSTTKQSSLYLLYKINSQLPDNSNNLWLLRETDFEDQLKWVKQVQTV